MPTIDADAHIIECEQTWADIKDEKLRPYMINPGGGRPQNWLVDGRVFNRADNTVARNLIRANHVYVACQTDDDLPYVLKYSGEDNIVIGSDYGHNDISTEIEALRTLKSKGKVEPRVIDKILYDNPRALYGI